MTIIFEERLSDSPLIETVIQGHTVGAGSTIRPSEIHWHMVFVKVGGRVHSLVVGPQRSSGEARWGADAEILWIKFKLGTFMPHLRAKEYVDLELALPAAACQSFWLNSSTWQLPDFENVETFIHRLVKQEVLVWDPLVTDVLRGQPQDLSPRTVRHRFLQATGLPPGHIEQYERAQRALMLLQQGVSILDTVYELGYYDQPHLTRSLQRFLGTTPGRENGRVSAPENY
ncbi:MAG: helix-turn-helix domain-containing protein [Ardenticatenaceae bacterium]|nr:helix-turn-helix domain-containing protein [Ardenticatenaceae bacterium]